MLGKEKRFEWAEKNESFGYTENHDFVEQSTAFCLGRISNNTTKFFINFVFLKVEFEFHYVGVLQFLSYKA